MPAAEMPRGLFITGTDTGVGKTLVGAALARLLTSTGVKVGVMKPAETGVEDVRLLGPDAQLLRWAADSELPAERICPYRLAAPIAPAVAASREQVRINYTDLLQTAQEIIAEHEFTIIEGAGGLLVPLAGGLLMADFAKALGLPVLVVCRPNLGTINHSLLTLFAARNLELPVAGYLINNMPENKGLAEETAPHTLASMTTDELLGVLNQVEGDDRQKVMALLTQLREMPTYPLLARYLPSQR